MNHTSIHTGGQNTGKQKLIINVQKQARDKNLYEQGDKSAKLKLYDDTILNSTQNR